MAYNKLIEEFNKVYKITENKFFLTDSELQQIEVFLKTDSLDGLGLSSNYQKNSFLNKVFKVKYSSSNEFREFFRGLQLNSNYKLREYYQNSDYYEEVFKNVHELSEYFNYLKNLITNPQKESPKKESLSLSQKILALHYLGLDLTKFDKTKSSKVLSKILNQNESNTKEHITNMYSAKNETKIKSLKNLKPLLEVFENEQFNEVQNKIKKDIEKLGVVD
jgi:hypothetical protein